MEERLRPSAPSFQPRADNCEVTRTQPDDGSQGEELNESTLGFRERIVGLEREQRTVNHQSRAVSNPTVRPVVPVPPAIPTRHPGPNMEAPQESGSFAPQTLPEYLSVTDSRDRCKCPHVCELFDADAAVSKFAGRFFTLWNRVGVWASIHANVPLQDRNLEPQAQWYLKSLADPSQLPALLSFPSTRHCLVAKAINHYLARNILKANIAGAFSTVASQEISEIQGQLAALEHSFLVRQFAVSAIISRTKSVLELPGFAAFLEGKRNTHVASLWQLVRPLSWDPSGSYQQARQELTDVVGEAQLLARDMYLAPFQYEFNFPVLDERFDPTTMVNYDFDMRRDPKRLKINDYRVKLSVTPITMIRDISVRPVDDMIVHLAQVLLKPAPFG